MKNVVMLGAGNVATHLATTLQKNGYRISQVYSRTSASAENLAKKLKTTFTTEINKIDKTADIFIYCVSDNALETVVQQFDHSEGLHLHTAGSISVDIFKNKRRNYGVLYPLQTFSKQKEIDFSSVPLFLEANSSENMSEIRLIAGKLSNKVYEISSEERMKMHISAVFACNFSNYLYQIASDLLGESHLPFDLMIPLIEETVAKLKSLTPYQAQTGPAVRNDRNVVNKHVKALEYDSEKQLVYQLLSDLIIKKHFVPNK
jgi:predicted short-subunit dehydrogenase-like oxidoreductase (DUF2520 family)